MYFILDGHEPVECADVIEWEKWVRKADRHVAETRKGNIRISTIFMGLNHNFSIGGTPILFETMVFGGKHDDYQERYDSWDRAEEGHKRAYKMVFGK